MIKAFFGRHWGIGWVLAVWVIFSSPFFLKGLIPFPSDYLVSFFPPWSAAAGIPVKNNAMPDIITQIYPWKRLTISQWKQGQIPLWNPFSFSGTPHAANFQTAIFSPLNLLFIIFPEKIAWGLLILLQPLLAGLCMYLYLRELRLSMAARTLGSLSFMFCGFMVVWMAYGTLGYAILWLPLLFFAIHRQFRKYSVSNTILVTLSVALSFFSGHFQMSIYVFGASLVYVIYKAMQSRQYKIGWSLFAAHLLGLLIVSPQLILSLDAYAQSVRSSSFLKGEIIPWNYLVTMLAPDFYGNPVTRNDWFGHYAEWSSYVGIVPFLCAMYAVFIKKKTEEIFFILIGLVALLLALPTPLTDALFALKIPVLSTSAASRVIILTSFSLSILAGFGLDGIQSNWLGKGRRKMLIFATSMLVIIGSIWLIMLVIKPLTVDQLVIAKRNFIFPSVGVIIAVVLFAAGFIKKSFVRMGVVVALLSLTSFDLLRFSTKWMPFESSQDMYPQLPMISFMQQRIGIDRMFGNFGNEFSTTFGLGSVEGYDALYQSRYGEFIASASNGKKEFSPRSVVNLGKKAQYAENVLELLGVRYYIQKKSDGRNVWAYPFWQYPQYKKIYEDNSFEVYQNELAFPRVFLLSSYLLGLNDQDILNKTFSLGSALRDTGVLEEKPLVEPSPGEGSVRILSYTPNNIKISVKTQVPKLLFVSDVFDSGWKASIDAKVTPLYRADYAFRAVGVPKGEHIIELTYMPRGAQVGLPLMGIGLGIMCVLIVKHIYENRHI